MEGGDQRPNTAGWQSHLCTFRANRTCDNTSLPHSLFFIINLFYVHVCCCVCVWVTVCLMSLWHKCKDKAWLSSCLGDRLLSKEKEAEGVLIKTTINTVASIKYLPIPISTSLRETHTEHRKLQRFYYCKFNKSRKGALFATRWGLCGNRAQVEHSVHPSVHPSNQPTPLILGRLMTRWSLTQLTWLG